MRQPTWRAPLQNRGDTMPEADIIGALADKAPWLLPIFLVLWMTRGEWKRIAGRSVVEEQADGALALLNAMSAATAKNVEFMAKNLEHFVELRKLVDRLVTLDERAADARRDLLETQNAILREMQRK